MKGRAHAGRQAHQRDRPVVEPLRLQNDEFAAQLRESVHEHQQIAVPFAAPGARGTNTGSCTPLSGPGDQVERTPV